MDSDSDKSSSEEELREMLRKDQDVDEKNKKLLNRQLSNTSQNINYITEGIFSRIFFNWAKLAMKISNQRVLKTSDVCALKKSQSTRFNIKNLQEAYNKYSSKKRKYPLMISIFVIHKALLSYLLFLDITSMILDYLRIFFFSKIITIFSEKSFFPEERTYHDIFINLKFNIVESTAAFITIKFIRAIMLNHLDFNNIILSEKITNEMTSILYEKIIKGNTATNKSAKGEGEKLNLIEEDAEEIGSLFSVIPQVITSLIKVGISLYFLFSLIGYRFFYAIIVLICLMFLIVILQIKYVKNLEILLKYKDKRMKIVTFVFQMLKNIKLNGWDEESINRIKIKRDDELLYTKKNLNIDIITFLLNSNINLLLMIIALGLYVTSNDKLEIAVLFTSFQLVNSMTIPIMLIPTHINQIFKDLISIERLQNYLFIEDHQENKYQDLNEYQDKDILIKFDNATFSFNEARHLETNDIKKNINKSQSTNDFSIELQQVNDPKSLLINNDEEDLKESDIQIKSIKKNNSKKQLITKDNDLNLILLRDISLTIKKGEFIAILGHTGAGKTCLLNAILNNYYIYKSNSKTVINGELSYASQQPWVMTDTVRNNIIFNNEFDEEKYNQVVSVCELEKDFMELPNGDKTEINSTSANVSGGQKARISLARCLYKDADIYLLDDPLASTDSKVGNKIFTKAFNKYLKNKARILVTNEINNLSTVDKIIYMEQGRIIFTGSFNEFNKTYGAKDMEIDINDNSKFNAQANKVRNFIRRNSSHKNITEYEITKANDEPKRSEKHNINNNPLSKLNKSKKKNISFETYMTFIKLQGGFCIFFILIIFVILTQIIESFRRLFATSLTKSSDLDLQKQFIKYVKISLCGIFFNFLVEFIVTRTTIHSLRKVHEDMINKLVRAPINLFHDIVPIGQILNRLTKDIGLIQGIIKTVNSAIKILFTLIANIGVCYLFNKYILFMSPLLFLACLLATHYYISAQRNLVRLHRVSYSPILTIASETIRGVDTIRTAHAEEDCRTKIYKRLDDHFGVHLYIEGAKSWYNITLRIFSNIFFGIIISYMGYYSNYFSAQAMAVILQGLEDLIESLLEGVKIYTNLEITMIGLERCEAVTKIQTEKKPKNDKTLFLKENKWPNKGKINFIEYFTSYRPDTPEILKNINIEIVPGDKVAIVGRTGSGKSSMVLALSRILEPNHGQIKIDDVDIQNVDLDYLRQSITIVPQESFIIEGNLRDNIDPLNKYTDDQILSFLDDFCLFKNVEKNEKLKIEIKEGGKNLSNGQKQLICFVRAMIKNNKIIILDEATSSLDIETEKIIQKNIEKYFKDVTLIMITHHIHMVKNCKKVIVIEQGRIVESGDYEELLKNKKTHFYSLYEESRKM